MWKYLNELTKKEFARINDAASERQLRKQLKDLNEEIIPDFLNIRISSTMSVPTLRALDAIYALRSWLSGASHDINNPAYSNLQVQRMWQILKALKTKYRRAKVLNDKIEIISLIDTPEEDLSCKNSDFAIGEATKLAHKYGSNLSPFQRLRLQLIFASEEIDNDNAVMDLLPDANTAFELGTLTQIEHRLPNSLREAIFNRFTLLLKAVIQQTSHIPLEGGLGGSTLEDLLTLFPYWNENPIYRQQIKNLTSSHLYTSSSILPTCATRLNDIAAEIYSKMDAINGNYKNRTA